MEAAVRGRRAVVTAVAVTMLRGPLRIAEEDRELLRVFARPRGRGFESGAVQAGQPGHGRVREDVGDRHCGGRRRGGRRGGDAAAGTGRILQSPSYGTEVALRELLLLLGSRPRRPRRPGLRCPRQPPTPRGGRHDWLASGESASAARRRCAPRTPSRRCRRCHGPCRCASPTSCSRPATATSTYGMDDTAQPRSLFHLSVLNPMVVERRGVEEHENTFFYR
ncbi:unnamed protein product [Miscanthus lutarioriparius]|uniref:Uncharacterized protein n=1 Tax=Miscanthus lutarioriparius TaxID=422564 RepID=A0A811SG35_9POAL|nr:unnamed protein product [Miscanthus lutarioriparius]